MLRHACGYALANAGHDTRSIQDYLGHIDPAHICFVTDLGSRLLALKTLCGDYKAFAAPVPVL
jgi:site-specific recombinase XerD